MLAKTSSLFIGLRAGQEEAYERLILKFQQPVYNLAYRLLSDTRLRCLRCHTGSFPEDLSQRRSVHVLREQPPALGRSDRRERKPQPAAVALPTPARNEVEWLEEEVEDSEPRERPLRDGARSPFDRAFDREKHALIQEALTRINPSFREAVVLRDLEDLSYEEIAEILQISIGTVKSRILRGREAPAHPIDRRS